MKIIAVPLKNDNQIADHFGHCKFYEIHIFSETNEILDVQLLESDLGCGCQSNIASILAEKGVTLMLAGNIGDNAIHKLNDAGIEVIRGCSGSSSEIILQFVEGKLFDKGSSCEHHSHEDGHECNH